MMQMFIINMEISQKTGMIVFAEYSKAIFNYGK